MRLYVYEDSLNCCNLYDIPDGEYRFPVKFIGSADSDSRFLEVQGDTAYEYGLYCTVLHEWQELGVYSVLSVPASWRFIPPYSREAWLWLERKWSCA